MRQVEKGTSWVLRVTESEANEGGRPDTLTFDPAALEVVEGDKEAYRRAAASFLCLCVGVPQAFREPGVDCGLYWDTKKVGDNLVKVTIRCAFEYDPNTRRPAWQLDAAATPA